MNKYITTSLLLRLILHMESFLQSMHRRSLWFHCVSSSVSLSFKASVNNTALTLTDVGIFGVLLTQYARQPSREILGHIQMNSCHRLKCPLNLLQLIPSPALRNKDITEAAQKESTPNKVAPKGGLGLK